MLFFERARQVVIEQVAAKRHLLLTEDVAIGEALGRVLAAEVRADRAYPPFDRSTRDGYAVRASEATAAARIRCVGEIKAGDVVTQPLAPGSCVQIMTGAAAPSGADAVVMIEHTKRDGDVVMFDGDARTGQNIVPRGSEAAAGQLLLTAGARLGYAELAIAAQVGAAQISCYCKPRVAVLSTGDEVVLVDQTPGPFQIRNSNSVSLAAQVRLVGAEPVTLGNATDHADDLRKKITLGLEADALILSGGVSMGKYDLVESVLKDLGAQFFFDAVAIRPGKPTVFGKCRETFVFGLPGNPVSTMVTFELFAVPALDLLAGAHARPLPLLSATLAEPMNEKPGLTHFLPARLEWRQGQAQVKPLRWQGSGDIAALAQADCFLVVPSDRPALAPGDSVQVLPRRDLL
jgi:molybdopterin molybdotransferase